MQLEKLTADIANTEGELVAAQTEVDARQKAVDTATANQAEPQKENAGTARVGSGATGLAAFAAAAGTAFDPKAFVDGVVAGINNNTMDVDDDDDDDDGNGDNKEGTAKKRDDNGEAGDGEGGEQQSRKKPRLGSGLAKTLSDKLAEGLAQQQAVHEQMLHQQQQQATKKLEELQSQMATLAASLAAGGAGSFRTQG